MWEELPGLLLIRAFAFVGIPGRLPFIWSQALWEAILFDLAGSASAPAISYRRLAFDLRNLMDRHVVDVL